MMDNVIVLLIDSVYSKCLTENPLDVSCTPFIDSLMEKSVFAPNVYSFGPYTDAATKGLYSGKPTLCDYGYYYGVNAAEENHFKTFRQNGYETYGFYYPYYLVSKKHEQYIDHSVYTSGFLYASVWNGKFVYYADLQKKRALTEQEYAVIIKCMEMVFDCWTVFYDNLQKQENAGLIVQRLFSENSGTGKAGLEAEYKKFLSGKQAYMDAVLAEGMDHALARINDFDFFKNTDPGFIQSVYQNNRRFFDKLARRNTLRNLRNNPLSLKKSLKRLKAFFRTGDKKELRYFGNYGMCLLSAQMTEKRAASGKNSSGSWQNLCSLNTQVETMLRLLGSRENTGKPFYCSLHCLEPHHDISFFSYDCDDLEAVSRELQYLRPVVDGCGKDFAGNLVYYLSLRYVDLCVKRMMEGLEKLGLADSTTIMLLADHGTSYVHVPVRTHVVNTFHRENYNIPVIIHSPKMTQKTLCGGLFDASDIFPTLMDVVGLKEKLGFSGLSMADAPEGRDYVITEYMGPGCPDMISREVWISIRSEKYVLAYRCGIDTPFDAEHPVYVYDLEKDPDEILNFANAPAVLQQEEVLALKQAVKVRFVQIQKETKSILDDFENFRVI